MKHCFKDGESQTILIDKDNESLNKKCEKKEVSPYKLVWDNSRCYLICGINNSKVSKKIELTNIRVDRMFEIHSECEKLKDGEGPKDPREFPEKSVFCDENQNIDYHKYLSSMIKMFPGKPIEMTFKVKKKYKKGIIERFGYDVKFETYKNDNTYIKAKILVQESQTFHGWLTGYNPNDIKLIGPPEQVEKYKEYLQGILAQY